MALPAMDGNFIYTLQQMEKASTPAQQKRLFKAFYETYGTHYITEVLAWKNDSVCFFGSLGASDDVNSP